jgi:hypothetical protein
VLLQVVPVPHVPQLPLQPLLPHCLPVQAGAQTHWPAAEQVSFALQLPQLPEQPLSPHFFVPQFGTHIQVPLLQVWPVGQPPQHWLLGMQAPLHVFCPVQHWSPAMHTPPPHDF